MKRLKRLLPAILVFAVMVCSLLFSACSCVSLAGSYQLQSIEYKKDGASTLIPAGEGEGYLPVDLVEVTFYSDGTIEMSTLLYSTDNVKEIVKGTWSNAGFASVDVTLDGETIKWTRLLNSVIFELPADDGSVMVIYLEKKSAV